MKRLTAIVILFVTLGLCCSSMAVAAEGDGWISLFNGKSLDGWKASEHPDSFRIQDGVIVVNGSRGHLFYVGKVQDHKFTNFHLKVDVKTTPGSNSGVYFHTRYQDSGWPKIGYECQVNQTHTDPKKSSGLYGLQDVFKTVVKDGEWYTQEIIVQGKHIVLKINGKTLVDYTEPAKVEGTRKLSSGTFAIQAHDPKSKVYVKNIRVKPLP